MTTTAANLITRLGCPASPRFLYDARGVLYDGQQTPMDIAAELRAWIVAVIYAFTGMALLFAGYKLFDAFTPTDLQRKVFDEGNVAVAVAVGFFMLGVAVVLHAALKV